MIENIPFTPAGMAILNNRLGLILERLNDLEERFAKLEEADRLDRKDGQLENKV